MALGGTWGHMQAPLGFFFLLSNSLHDDGPGLRFYPHFHD